MLKKIADVEIFIASILIFINFAHLIQSKKQTQKTIDMKKTLLSALKHGSGILLTLFSLLCSCQVWAEEYTIYFLRPSGEGRWGNTPRVHIYYNDGSSDHVIVDGGTSDGDMSNVAAELYSKTFETDKTSIYLIFNKKANSKIST